MKTTETSAVVRRTSRPNRITRAKLVEMLAENASREYRAILGSIVDHQCDSLVNFAMAEHLRSLMTAKPGHIR